MTEITDDILDVDQVAQLLKVGRNKVYQLIREQGLPCIVGWDKKKRFLRQSVLTWLSTQEHVVQKRSSYHANKKRKGRA